MFASVVGTGTVALLLDVLLNGVTIFDTVEATHRRLRMEAISLDSDDTDEADAYVLDPTNVLLAEGDLITNVIDQIADGTAHNGLLYNFEASV
jgi:hypothetical protein